MGKLPSRARQLRSARKKVMNPNGHGAQRMLGVLSDSPLKAVPSPGSRWTSIQTQFYTPETQSFSSSSHSFFVHRYTHTHTPTTPQLLEKIEQTWVTVAKYMYARGAHQTGREADENLANELGYSCGRVLRAVVARATQRGSAIHKRGSGRKRQLSHYRAHRFVQSKAHQFGGKFTLQQMAVLLCTKFGYGSIPTVKAIMTEYGWVKVGNMYNSFLYIIYIIYLCYSEFSGLSLSSHLPTKQLDLHGPNFD